MCGCATREEYVFVYLRACVRARVGRHVIVRSPFREEHLVVVPKNFFGIYANSAKMSPFVPSHVPYITPPPYRGQLVAIGAGLGQLVHMVHQCIQAYIWVLLTRSSKLIGCYDNERERGWVWFP